MLIKRLLSILLMLDSFIGGEILHTLARAGHSGLHITSLVRDASKAQQVQSAYPEVKTILGDLDDTELIKEQSKAADVVLSTWHQAFDISSTNVSLKTSLLLDTQLVPKPLLRVCRPVRKRHRNPATGSKYQELQSTLRKRSAQAVSATQLMTLTMTSKIRRRSCPLSRRTPSESWRTLSSRNLHHQSRRR